MTRLEVVVEQELLCDSSVSANRILKPKLAHRVRVSVGMPQCGYALPTTGFLSSVSNGHNGVRFGFGILFSEAEVASPLSWRT